MPEYACLIIRFTICEGNLMTLRFVTLTLTTSGRQAHMYRNRNAKAENRFQTCIEIQSGCVVLRQGGREADRVRTLLNNKNVMLR